MECYNCKHYICAPPGTKRDGICTFHEKIIKDTKSEVCDSFQSIKDEPYESIGPVVLSFLGNNYIYHDPISVMINRNVIFDGNTITNITIESVKEPVEIRPL